MKIKLITQSSTIMSLILVLLGYKFISNDIMTQFYYGCMIIVLVLTIKDKSDLQTIIICILLAPIYIITISLTFILKNIKPINNWINYE